MSYKCVECGKDEKASYAKDVKEQMTERQLCFRCNFWTNYVEQRDHPSVVRIGGNHYWIGDEDKRGMRGFGGARFKIKFHSGRYVESTNVWYQGEIPERFRDRLPDNAEVIQ